MPVYDCLWSNERGRNQVPTIFVPHHWLLTAGPCLFTPLDSSWKGGTVLEPWAYCVPISVGWVSSHLFISSKLRLCMFFLFCFWLRWAEKAKSLASRKNPMDRGAWSQRFKQNWSALAQARCYLVDCVSWVARLTNKLDLGTCSQTGICSYVGDLL